MHRERHLAPQQGIFGDQARLMRPDLQHLSALSLVLRAVFLLFLNFVFLFSKNSISEK